MNYQTVLREIFGQYEGPGFAVAYWDGTSERFGDGSKPAFTLRFTSPEVVARLFSTGALGFGEAYMDRTLDIEGDLQAYLRVRHRLKHVRPSVRLALAKLRAQLTTPKQRAGQIAYHYDLGNDFFDLFLDTETMSYSAGRFDAETNTLPIAQRNKLELVCDWLALPDGARVLDLGSGWGGFATHAARTRGWRVVGNTLSAKQLEYSRALSSRQALDDRVQFTYQDFTSLEDRTKYEGAVMIEALEHVGQGNLGSFLRQISERLAPGAPFYLQFTGRYQPKAVDPWTLKYVFPGGHLPAKSEFLAAVAESGLVLEQFVDHTSDYERTMATWVAAIEAQQDKIEGVFDDRFFRLWQLWTNGAQVNFALGDMNLFRVLLRKPGEANE